MLAKLLCIVTILDLWLGWDIELPRKDLILLESGEKVEGHIMDITDGVVEIKTEGGEKTIVRKGDKYSIRDIMEIGIINNKRYAGNIKFYKDDIVLETSSGVLKFDRALVRKIILSHESALPPLNL